MVFELFKYLRPILVKNVVLKQRRFQITQPHLDLSSIALFQLTRDAASIALVDPKEIPSESGDFVYDCFMNGLDNQMIKRNRHQNTIDKDNLTS